MKEERRAQVLGWVQTANSPTFLGHGLADFCAVFAIWYRIYSARIRQCCFFLKIASFGHHVKCSVGLSTPKVTFLLPNLTPRDFRSMTPRFLFQPIYRLHEKFGLNLFSDLGEIASLKMFKNISEN